MNLTSYTLVDDAGEAHTLPTCWALCPTCRGEGRSSAYLGAFTKEDFDEDPDFARDYVAGHYDRDCDTCGGTGKVKVVNEDRLTPAQRLLYEQAAEEERQYQEACRLERLLGA